MEKVEFSFKVPRERLSEHVVKHIQGLIKTGDLKPGDRLSTEPELCRQFEVSRTVIREAMTSLAGHGLLTIEPGRGTFVSAMSPERISESLSLFVSSSDVSTRNVSEVREVLEVKIAEVAAERAKPENLAEMKRILEEMDKTAGSLEDYITADFDFHLALAQATQNELFVALIASLVDELQDVRRRSATVRPEFKESQADHRAIFEFVKGHDKASAAEAMRQHLQGVRARALEA